jgi:hypothetical protein
MKQLYNKDWSAVLVVIIIIICWERQGPGILIPSSQLHHPAAGSSQPSPLQCATRAIIPEEEEH